MFDANDVAAIVQGFLFCENDVAPYTDNYVQVVTLHSASVLFVATYLVSQVHFVVVDVTFNMRLVMIQ